MIGLFDLLGVRSPRGVQAPSRSRAGRRLRERRQDLASALPTTAARQWDRVMQAYPGSDSWHQRPAVDVRAAAPLGRKAESEKNPTDHRLARKSAGGGRIFADPVRALGRTLATEHQFSRGAMDDRQAISACGGAAATQARPQPGSRTSSGVRMRRAGRSASRWETGDGWCLWVVYHLLDPSRPAHVLEAVLGVA
jgi:hypothetical protein